MGFDKGCGERPRSPALPLVPGPSVRSGPDHRRRDGTDAALALAKGAKHVDAVEIDPELAQIGRDFHPEGVYSDPRVTVHVNDGRAFLNGTDEKYDLIVYALTDSLTLVSQTAGVRLESFLFTEESMAEARDHLAPDGLFAMYTLPRTVARHEARRDAR